MKFPEAEDIFLKGKVSTQKTGLLTILPKSIANTNTNII